MKKILSLFTLIAFIFIPLNASADVKAVLKLRKPTSSVNSSGSIFTIPAKEKIEFFSSTSVTRSTKNVFARTTRTFNSSSAGVDEAVASLSFKVPEKKKKKKKKKSNSRGTLVKNKKNSGSRGKITKTIGITFRKASNVSTELSREKLYSVKKFKKKKTKGGFVYSGVIKDGRQALGRFRIKTDKN